MRGLGMLLSSNGVSAVLDLCIGAGRRALANIKCCHVFSFYAATCVFGDSGRPVLSTSRRS